MLRPTLLLAALHLLVIGTHAQQACNGYSELCDRAYDKVVHIGAHDSFAVSETTTNIAATQSFNVTTQLNNGVRLLQGQGHLKGNIIELCHTACLIYDGGSLTDYLGEVKTFLDDNPNEVVTLLWVNYDNQPVSMFAQSYQESGIESYAYTPPSVPMAYGTWPTLASLISANTRLVSFIASQADYSSVSYLLDEFSMIWETPYNSLDPTFPCTIDRPPNDGANKMYMMNHFLDVATTILGQPAVTPDLDAIETTNGVDSIMANANNCISLHQQNPTFILLDYYDRGNGTVFEAAAQLNGVTYAERPVGNASITQSTRVQAAESSALTVQMLGLLFVACLSVATFIVA